MLDLIEKKDIPQKSTHHSRPLLGVQHDPDAPSPGAGALRLFFGFSPLSLPAVEALSPQGGHWVLPRSTCDRRGALRSFRTWCVSTVSVETQPPEAGGLSLACPWPVPGLSSPKPERVTLAGPARCTDRLPARRGRQQGRAEPGLHLCSRWFSSEAVGGLMSLHRLCFAGPAPPGIFREQFSKANKVGGLEAWS